jgi:nucleoside-diphosphate-sugar epimerase
MTTTSLPKTIDSTEQLLEIMSRPTDGVRKAVRSLDGEFLVLGAGGKMGPSLCQMLIRAGARVTAVDLYPGDVGCKVREQLDALGCKSIQCDLLDPEALKTLPECPNVMIMVGFKFGSSENQGALWTMNALLPAQIIARFPKSRHLLMSSGNVYKFTPVTGTGATEQDPTEPIGAYAQSRLAGEHVARYIAERQKTKLIVVRLFYSTELRYGIIHDIATHIKAGDNIDVSMGHVNQIWQGDANAYLIQFLTIADCPTRTINITGENVLSVREIAMKLGKIMGVQPKIVGQEADTALLGNSEQAFKLFGRPTVDPWQVVQWVGPWVKENKGSLGKPTKYERRDGKF